MARLDIPFIIFASLWAIAITISLIAWIYRTRFPPSIVLAFSGIMLLFITISIDNILINSFAFQDGEENYMNVITSSGGITIRQDSSWIRTEFVANSASVLANKEVNCLTAQLSRNGSPDFDTPIIFGVFDSSANTKYEFGRMNVTATTGSIQLFKQCNPNSTYTIVSGDRLGIKWQDGDSTNNIAIRWDVNDPFDGTNTVSSAYSGSWTQTTGTDYSLIIGLETGQAEITFEKFELRNPTTFEPNTIGLAFIIMSVMFVMVGALIEGFGRDKGGGMFEL